MSSGFDDITNDSILYELLEYLVRKQEPELLRCKNDIVPTTLPSPGSIKNAIRYFNNRYSLPESISQRVNSSLPWKLAVGDGGRVIAILQENLIEIRKAKDEYSSLVGKAMVPKDAFPQWRKISWNPDGSILVLGCSNGYVCFYNSLGNNIFNINPKQTSPNPRVLEAGDAIASMVFLKAKNRGERWTDEFLLVTYDGVVKSFCVSGSNGYLINYEHSFASTYRNGINCVEYDEKHNLLIVAGNTVLQKLTSPAAQIGLTAWRVLNDYPYFKLSVAFEENSDIGSSKFSLWNYIPRLSSKSESYVSKIRISPDSDRLVALHTDGTISLWNLPHLKLQERWSLTEQPEYNIPNPLNSVTKVKRATTTLLEYHPVDVGWWSNDSIIISRYSGSISVCSIGSLQNRLGTCPDFLSGQSQISELSLNHGFLCLDCEVVVVSKKRTRKSSGDGNSLEASSESEVEEDEETDGMSVLNYTTSVIQNAIYFVTDIEQFQPKRRKSRVMFRTYRILGIKSTTPEELYSRKIEIEEYEEALALANTYNLDTDLVYQTQWRKSEFSVNAIREHLSKVSKRSWLLQECVIRVPETMEAARELLRFGLRGANLETFLAIADHDDGKFVVGDEDWQEGVDASENLRKVQKINEILSGLTQSSLTQSQKDLVRYRRQLLDHLDKLQTYEVILESSEKYDKTVYEEFRKLTVVENAVKFAKEGDCSAVDKMLRYHGRKLRKHWLAILSFFPETLSPVKYRHLLPECDGEGQLYLLPQEELRRQDWSEHALFAGIMSDFDGYDSTEANFIYEMDPTLTVYRTDELSQDLIRGWYESRARQVERRSFMVDNAVELIKIGVSHCVRGLEGLLLQLETLEDLVYKVFLVDMSLTELEKLTDLEKVHLLMSGSDEKNFVAHLKLTVLPFLKRKQKYLGGALEKQLLRDYLVSVSKESLKLPAKLFDYLKQSRDVEILEAIEDLTSLALDCLYSCVDLNLYQQAKSIFDSIQERGRGKTRSYPLQNLDELERELESIRLFNLYLVKTTLKYLKEHKHDPETSKLLLVEMARNVTKRIPVPDEKVWAQLLNDILEIHSLIFMCLDVERCFEICVAARLSSGVKSTIQNCANLIETRKNEESLLKVSYPKAADLILEASQEYFNTSKSLSDFNMELAKTCLNLIVDENAQIKEEYELIKSLEILREFHVDILPLQVRLTQDRLKLIDLCLNTREDAYKCRQRLLTLANHLAIEKNNSRVREGKVLELIAVKAFGAGDYKVCSATCANLMENNYLSAWRIIKDLGYCEHFQDLEFRKKCLWFVVNNGTNEIIREILQQLHLIEVQILNSEIQISLPIPEEEQEDLDLDSEDDFTDAVTTPQVETKEFVPKILESSTELVRNSAQLMKQSTLGLVQNVKSKLRFHSSRTNNDPKKSYSDQENEDAQETSLQSFPCFYESLHERCNVSYLDVDYTRYSKQEVSNKRLKLCQTLIRLALLSESSCCGLEISDISHLFLECAKYTLHADCLLGLSYLFGTSDNAVENVQTLLMELPQTDLYLQILAYYYSLEYYKKVYEDTPEIYRFDPMDLIRKVMEATTENDDTLRHLRRKLVPRGSPEVERGVSFESAEDNNPLESDKNSGNELFQVQEAVVEESGWSDNDWGDFPDEFEDNEVLEDPSCPVCAEEPLESEEERFQNLERLISEAKDLDDYENAKKAFTRNPEFSNPDYLMLDKHPVLNLVKIALKFLPRKNHEREILEEVKSLFAGGPRIENDVFREFVRQQDENLTIQQRIHLRLCGDDKTLQEEAVELVKKNYRDLELQPQVLEELFFKNLTARFSSNHTVYSQIIEHVFMNRTVEEVRENVNVLIEDLMAQKNLPLAVVLLNHLEEIPLSLGTFENSVQLLSRK